MAENARLTIAQRATARDLEQRIVEKTELSQALARSEERYRAVAEMVTFYAFCIWQTATGKWVLEWEIPDQQPTRQAASDDPQTAALWQLIQHPEQWPGYASLVAGQSTTHEVRQSLPDGSIKYLSIFLRPVSTEGRLIRVLGAVSDITERKRAEEALRDSESMLRALVDRSPDGIALSDEHGRIVEWNQAQTELTGLSYEQVVGRPVTEVIAESLPPDVARSFTPEVISTRISAMRQGIPMAPGLELRDVELRRSDGRYRVVNIVPFPIQVGHGFHLGTIIHDVTERHRNAVALQESEARFRRLAENAPDVIYRFSVLSKPLLEYISPAITALTGYTPEEFYADPSLATRLVHPDDYHIVQATLAGQVSPAAPMTMRWISRSGGVRWTEQRAVPIYDDHGRLVLVEGIARDITDRKLAEEDLQMRAELLDAALDTILLSDLRGRIVYANQQAWKSRGYTQDEFLQFTIADIDASMQPEQANALISSLRQQGMVHLESQHRRKDSSLFPVDIRARLVTLHDATLVLLVITDVTEQHHAHAEIRRALVKEQELNELKSQFIATTSHEFRTPLSTILSSAELIEHYGDRWSAEKKRYYLRLISESCQYMTEMLGDVLTISQAEAGKLTFEPEAMDVVEFCRRIAEEAQLTAGNRYSITFAYSAAYPIVNLSPKLLRQILVNLLSNAVKYSPDGGGVHMELTCSASQIRISVQDHGIGIPPEAQPKLFDLFHRAANVGTIRGTGLGLAIVKRSVELHSGAIEYTSQVGIGTTFVVTLPLTVQ